MRMTRLATLAAMALVLWVSAAADAQKKPAPTQRSLQPLVDQGSAALSAGDHRAARDAFADALSLEARHPRALHGLALAYAGLEDWARAAATIDKALAASPDDRRVVLNLAAIQLKAKNPMRGVKAVKESLAARPGDRDETLADALAVALAQADEQARRSRLHTDAAAFHKTYVARLEAARPGLRRWGTRWLPASEVEAFEARRQTIEKNVSRLQAEVAALDQRLAEARRETSKIQQKVNTGFDPPSVLQRHLDRVSKMEQERAGKQQAIEEARSGVPQPPLPDSIALVGLDAMLPMEPSSPQEAVAKAGEADAKAGEADAPPASPPPGPKAPEEAAPDAAAPQASAPDPATAPATPPATPPAPRRPVVQHAAAFPVGPDLLVTAAAVVQHAESIQLQSGDRDPVEAELVRTDAASGLALLRVNGMKVTPLPLAAEAKAGAVQCAAFPTVNLFAPTAELIPGSVPAPQEAWKVRLQRHPRLPGAPLLMNGKVMGVLLATRDDETSRLPAVPLAQLRAFLAADAAPASPSGAGPDPSAVMFQVSATHRPE